MRPVINIVYGFMVYLFFSCTANDELLNVEKNTDLNLNAIESEIFALEVSESYSQNSDYLELDAIEEPENFLGMWQLQYYNSQSGEWEFVGEADADYSCGIFLGDHFQLRKSHFDYGDIEFRARKIRDFEYKEEPNELTGYVTRWTNPCTIHNNYMKEAGGLLTDSYVTIVLDFVFSSSDYEALRIGKDTYATGFDAVIVGFYPGGNMKVPPPSKHTEKFYRYRYAYKVDKADFESNVISVWINNLRRDRMDWEDKYFSVQVDQTHSPIMYTIPVSVCKHEPNDYIYDAFGNKVRDY